VALPMNRKVYDRMLRELAGKSRYNPAAAGASRVEETWQVH